MEQNSCQSSLLRVPLMALTVAVFVVERNTFHLFEIPFLGRIGSFSLARSSEGLAQVRENC